MNDIAKRTNKIEPVGTGIGRAIENITQDENNNGHTKDIPIDPGTSPEERT